MKRNYEAPEMSKIFTEEVDVVTTSIPTPPVGTLPLQPLGGYDEDIESI